MRYVLITFKNHSGTIRINLQDDDTAAATFALMVRKFVGENPDLYWFTATNSVDLSTVAALQLLRDFN